jgi:hypothetical protein
MTEIRGIQPNPEKSVLTGRVMPDAITIQKFITIKNRPDIKEQTGNQG